MHPPVKQLSRSELTRWALRSLVGLALLLGGMIALANTFRAPLERLGVTFVERFGYSGMTLGTFIADGFHFPIPPQFYMLMAVTSGVSQVASLAAITGGSLAGGLAGYHLSAKLARVPVIARRLERARGFAERAFSRFGYRAALLASVLPIAYSVLCYLAGIYGLPRRVFGVLWLCRIPKLLAYYYLVRLGWSAH
jgi:membrane protein YqaA with SNARE-associated domain